MTGRFLRLAILPGLRVFLAKAASRGGSSGGLGAFDER